MLTKKRYSLYDMINWTRKEIFGFVIYLVVIVILYEYIGLTFLALPWLPIGLIGTAVAFMLGFQNSATYSRIWNAATIWGSISNASRNLAYKLTVMLNDDYSDNKISEIEIRREIDKILNRHFAWLTLMRYEMRSRRKWEVFHEHSTNQEWSEQIYVPEHNEDLGKELQKYLKEEELQYLKNFRVKCNAIMNLQNEHLHELKKKNMIWEFSYIELLNNFQALVELQGKSEGIKNFPYPKQYATLGYIFIWAFLLFVPMGIIPEFKNIGEKLDLPIWKESFIWLSVPFTLIVMWIFHTMERIGRVGENPFEGSANDVPISTISKNIEIDMLQIVDIKNAIPQQFPERYDVVL